MNNGTKINEDFCCVLATASKLETIQSNLESVIDFFLAPIVKLYSKLCNDCLKLLFECEFKLDHFRRAEELVWKRIYHDIYSFQRTRRQFIKRHEECLMESHFISGIGFYSSLIVKLRSHYKIYDVPGVVIPLNLNLGPLDNLVDNQHLNEDDGCDGAYVSNMISVGEGNDSNQNMAKEWARQAIYRSLVYMGDLARYLLETSQFDYRKLAFEFYKSAFRNQPDYGLPFNQLAFLAGGLNYNLDAICNYMRCCSRPKPYGGAEGNIKQLFELNNEFYDIISKEKHITKVSEVFSSKDPCTAAESMMRTIIVSFIKLTSDLWMIISGNNNESIKEHVDEETKLFFEKLREAIELEPIVPLSASNNMESRFCPISGGSSDTVQPRYVSPTIMYEFCSISIMLIALCQKHRESKADYVDDPAVNLVNTLALNLLHYSTSKCQKIILSKVQDIKLSRHEFIQTNKNAKLLPGPNLESSRGDLSNSSRKSADTLNSMNETPSKRALSRLRQRRAATNYSGNDNRIRPIIPHNEDSDMSELEETALSTIDALEISSDMSEDADYQFNDLIDLDSSGDDVSTRDRSYVQVPRNRNLSKPLLRPTRSQNYERECSSKLMNSPYSLPVPDLLTGEASELMSTYKYCAASQSLEDSINGSEARERSLPNLADKESSLTAGITDVKSAWEFIYLQTYLPTIKIFCDWLLSNGTIIRSNLQSFRVFWAELDDLISLIQDMIRMTDANTRNISNLEMSSFTNIDDELDGNSIFEHFFDGPKWVQKYPLSCDYPLLNLGPLKNAHELNINFNDCSRDLTDSEAGHVTVQCVVAFFHALTVVVDNKAFQ